MADYTRRERVTRTYEWAVPGPNSVDELDKAYAAAVADYKKRHGIAHEAPLPITTDLRVRTWDEEIVIYYEIQEETRG